MKPVGGGQPVVQNQAVGSTAVAEPQKETEQVSNNPEPSKNNGAVANQMKGEMGFNGQAQAAAVAACGSRLAFSTADPCHIGFYLGVVNADSGTRDANAQSSCETVRPQNITAGVWSRACESAFARGEDWYDAR